MNASRHPIWLSLLLGLSAASLAACGDQPAPIAAVEPAAPADFERGPHNGRLLRDGDVSLEVTVFEDGVPPEFHVYPFRNNQPLDPRQVQLGMSVSRLGGEVNQFAFTAAAGLSARRRRGGRAAFLRCRGHGVAQRRAARLELCELRGPHDDRAGSGRRGGREDRDRRSGRAGGIDRGRRPRRASAAGTQRGARLVSGPRDGDDQGHRPARAEGRDRRARRIELEPSDLSDPRADGGRDHGAATRASAMSPAIGRCT